MQVVYIIKNRRESVRITRSSAAEKGALFSFLKVAIRYQKLWL